ncbi:HDOD domain-containing protein [sulfur-oxidizing endosymbiont of Gigantopelta aegis]|uniref:HDOD domain-containing protein n=1 Tax=sulfur-oxidizing endosymbiont of Gigantopelta aegis TaxID=2794934 RepID=UPI0018DD39FD|nr:HDOD domain-containing protein [sulfur-oxidizing endosymbiont of Gigantopelta aegis]
MTACINELKELPPLSTSAREILKIVHNDDAHVYELTRIIEQDPALLSRIIGLANSAFFGSREVSGVQRAIIDVLGFRTAKNIVLGVVLGGIFNPQKCRSFDLPRYWFVSLMTATLAKDIAQELKMSSMDANDAYLSGMLNEVGLMALAYLYPNKLEAILSEKSSHLAEREKDVFGQSHYEISAQFLREWQLPEIVMEVMLESCHLLKKECGELCSVICLAHSLANMIYEEAPIELGEMSLPKILKHRTGMIRKIIDKTKGQAGIYREMASVLS